jgi:threonine dehydrogenase-like Zn-dependent dehydrogenase
MKPKAPKTFNAAIYKDIGDVYFKELPYPKCGDGDIVVKNIIAGICGSDVAAFNEGGDANMIWKDSEFGHEMVSEVFEVGKNVKDIKVGDYVFPNMGNAKRDFNRMATVGGFSEYIHIPQFEINYSAIKLDKSMPLTDLVLLEPFVIGTKGAKNTNPGPGKTGIVFGAGIIGMSAAIMLKWYGCDKVMIVDISDYRLGNAQKMGLITCNPHKENLKDKAISEFGSMQRFPDEGCGADVYVDALAVDDSFGYFLQLARHSAFMSVVGVHHHPITLDFVNICYNNFTISGCGGGTYEEVSIDVLEMMKSGKFDLSPLVSHQFKHTDIVDALKLASNPEKAQKVAITY